MALCLRRPAADQNLARVGLVHARQNLDQGRLSGAVLAEERMRLAASDVEVDLIEGQGRGKALRDAPHHEEGAASSVTDRCATCMTNFPIRSRVRSTKARSGAHSTDFTLCWPPRRHCEVASL